MADTNKVILARPNPFIVDKMKGFLVNCGYTPTPLKDLHDIDNMASDGVVGAVVSTTVVSSVDESAEDVVIALRKHFGPIPVMFASMVPEEAIKETLKRKLKKVSDNPRVLSVKKAYMDHSLGDADTFLVVAQADLEDQKFAATVVEKHFVKK
jgi:hypothetical protein